MNYIFDLDDTLIHNSDIVYNAVNQLLKEALRGRNREDLKLAGNSYQKLKELYAHYHYLKTREYMQEGLIGLAPGVKEFLEREGFHAGLTNAPYRSTMFKLEELGLEEMLDPVRTPRSMERKPSPDGIETIIEDSGLQKQKTVYVGDSLKDLIAGRRAGVRTILISSELKRFFADEHYPTFRDFVDNH